MRIEESLPHREEISGSFARDSKKVWKEPPGNKSFKLRLTLLLSLM